MLVGLLACLSVGLFDGLIRVSPYVISRYDREMNALQNTNVAAGTMEARERIEKLKAFISRQRSHIKEGDTIIARDRKRAKKSGGKKTKHKGSGGGGGASSSAEGALLGTRVEELDRKMEKLSNRVEYRMDALERLLAGVAERLQDSTARPL